MKKVSNYLIKFGSVIASLALFIGVSSASTACYFWFNQPEMPESIEKFRKNK